MRIKLELLQILNSNKTPKSHCAQTQIMTIQIVTNSNIKNSKTKITTKQKKTLKLQLNSNSDKLKNSVLTTKILKL